MLAQRHHPWLITKASSFTGVSFGRYYLNGRQVDKATYEAAKRGGGSRPNDLLDEAMNAPTAKPASKPAGDIRSGGPDIFGDPGPEMRPERSKPQARKPGFKPAPASKPTAPAVPGGDAFADYQPGSQDLRRHPGAKPTPMPPALPHHRTQQAAVKAVMAIKTGGPQAHAAAVQALNDHYQAGKAHIDRTSRDPQHAAERHRLFRQKLSAARAKVDTMAGKGPPPVPQGSQQQGPYPQRYTGQQGPHPVIVPPTKRGKEPPPLSQRGRVAPWISMKSYGGAPTVTMADLDVLTLVTSGRYPWVVKTRDSSGHEHASDGRFGQGGSHAPKPATRKPGAQYDRKPSANGKPSGDPHAKAQSLAKRIKEVPTKLRHQVTSFVRGRFRRLSKRYGTKGAYAIMGAMILLLPAPVPGSSLIPVAVAECVLALRRAIGKAFDGLDEATIQREAKALLAELYKACGEELPK